MVVNVPTGYSDLSLGARDLLRNLAMRDKKDSCPKTCKQAVFSVGGVFSSAALTKHQKKIRLTGETKENKLW